tara:strand:+ start:77700 stop:78566 length:867 start_codon:yes stop_codon:yes gene_type:complete
MEKEIVGWKASAKINKSDISIYEEILFPLEAAIDTGKEENQWNINAFFPATQSKESILNAFKIADEISGTTLNISLTVVYDDDWKATMKHGFPPLEVGGFFVHSFEEEAPEGMVSLKVPAGMAFGTGEHPTTAASLTLYDEITSEDDKFNNILDMGCGSAILAMGAAKKNGTFCLAVDIDETSIDVAIENCIFNNVADKVTCAVSDGFKSEIVQSKAPYDLIFANILANPLIEMSTDLINCLDDGGVAILSGFLTTQKDAVVQAYEEKGMTLLNEITIDKWMAVTVVK